MWLTFLEHLEFVRVRAIGGDDSDETEVELRREFV
jgi:hypothetical protein